MIQLNFSNKIRKEGQFWFHVDIKQKYMTLKKLASGFAVPYGQTLRPTVRHGDALPTLLSESSLMPPEELSAVQAQINESPAPAWWKWNELIRSSSDINNSAYFSSWSAAILFISSSLAAWTLRTISRSFSDINSLFLSNADVRTSISDCRPEREKDTVTIVKQVQRK